MRLIRKGTSKGDDEPELATFVALRGGSLLRLAWLLTADGPAAEDLVQEALARAIPRWSAIAPGGHEAYLRQVVRSVWIDTWRRRQARGLDRQGPLELVDEPFTVDSGVEGTPDRLALGEALARLTPRQRAVLVLRFYEDQTERETARALGCSVNTVKSQTRHALERLRVLAPELAAVVGREVGPEIGREGAPGNGRQVGPQNGREVTREGLASENSRGVTRERPAPMTIAKEATR